MPYRRLPNTDSARVKALKKAIAVSMKVSPYTLAFSQLTLHKAKTFLPLFDQAISRQKDAYRNQVEKSKIYYELTKKARLYISHFLQVLNMMVMRGEIPAVDRKFYGLDEDCKIIPNLNTEADLIHWGKTIIKGDQERQRGNVKMITNPTAAIVRVHFEKFEQSYNNQKSLQKIHGHTTSKVAELRLQADSIILQIWNEVETTFSELPDDERREKASEYGLVYVYRPSEKKNGIQKKLDNTRKAALQASQQQREPGVPVTELSGNFLLFSEDL
jgi:hypothetical protein